MAAQRHELALDISVPSAGFGSVPASSSLIPSVAFLVSGPSPRQARRQPSANKRRSESLDESKKQVYYRLTMCFPFSANTPWNRVRLILGFGTGPTPAPVSMNAIPPLRSGWVRSPVPVGLLPPPTSASLTTLESWLSLLFPATDQHPAGSWAHRPKGEGGYFLSLTTSAWTSAGLPKMGPEGSKKLVLMA